MKKFIFLVFILAQSVVYSQNLEGMEGLFFIPTAEVKEDAKLAFGINYLNKNIVSFGRFKYDAANYYITLNFLPFIQSSIRITRFRGSPPNTTQAIGDRTASIKIRLFEESDIRPAVSIGIHDLFTVFGGEAAVHNNAFYLVATKNMELDSFLSNIALTIGYGSDLMRAENHNFVGLFGGAAFRVFQYLDLLIEYDTKRMNGGVKAKLFNHLNLLIGALDFKYISSGISFSFQI